MKNNSVGKIMEFNCRDFMKVNVVMVVVVVVGMMIFVKSVYVEDMGIKWDKVLCCFCGIGCSVLVGIKDGCVVVI